MKSEDFASREPRHVCARATVSKRGKRVARRDSACAAALLPSALPASDKFTSLSTHQLSHISFLCTHFRTHPLIRSTSFFVRPSCLSTANSATMSPKQQQVYMLVDPNKFDVDGVIGVYGSKKSADAALSAEGAGFEVQSMEVKEFVATETKGSKAKAYATHISQLQELLLTSYPVPPTPKPKHPRRPSSRSRTGRTTMKTRRLTKATRHPPKRPQASNRPSQRTTAGSTSQKASLALSKESSSCSPAPLTPWIATPAKPRPSSTEPR